ncbi:MAG: Uma2 family endonuclease, partial [Gemmataceae bacterium]
TETGYLYKKTHKLFDFGVQKLIWVLTDAQVVMIATPKLIETVSWNKDVEIMDGHSFNIGAYLAKKGITVT